ncbi:MAG: hypothetical protein GY869_17270, partial [Planctomycetes bacterium]|nr:hypothetical protein [Planctomycetota bacterium]
IMIRNSNPTGDRAGANRRRKEDRRVSISASVEDRRLLGDRRSLADRRGHYFNLFDPRDDFLYEVFIWLIDSTEGEWASGANENEPKDSPVTCRIRFDEESDLRAFITWLDEWEEKHH